MVLGVKKETTDQPEANGILSFKVVMRLEYRFFPVKFEVSRTAVFPRQFRRSWLPNGNIIMGYETGPIKHFHEMMSNSEAKYDFVEGRDKRKASPAFSCAHAGAKSLGIPVNINGLMSQQL